MRSLLFVPTDNERKLEKALSCGADALILDLEDSIAPAAKEEARKRAATFLQEQKNQPGAPRFIVRVNGLASGQTDADLDAVMTAQPWGIMLPKSESGADVQQLGAKLAVREAENAISSGVTAIIPIATETAAAIFGLGSYRDASKRLHALTWGAEDLAAGLAAVTNRMPDGRWTPPFALARNMMLFSAASAAVDAIDTVFVNFRDTEGLQRECEEAVRDGFAGKMAIHPDQVAVINSIFTPGGDELAKARAVVAAFEEEPDAGVLSIDGHMVDRPHLRNAQRLLLRAEMADSQR